MSTFDTTVDQHTGAPARVVDDTATAVGGTRDESPGPLALVGALASSDHKVIGRFLIGFSVLGTVVAAALGVLLGLWRISGDGDLFDTDLAPELFTGYRLGLVFGGLVPFLLGVAVVVVPLQLGARSLAFPRAAAAGMWTWLFGLVLVIISLFNSGGPGGTDQDMVLLYVAATGLLMVGLTLVAGAVATSVLTTRAPGMRLSRTPLFAWSTLVYSIGLTLALPVALGVIVYLYLDVRYGSAETSLFGGAAGIGDWSSWLLTGPSLALFAVPAVGFLAELLPVVFRKRTPMRGIALTGVSLVGVGVLAGVMQQRVIELPGTGNEVNGHNWGTKLGELALWAITNLAPVLGVVIVLVGIGGMLAKPAPKAQRRSGTAPKPAVVPAALLALLGAVIAAAGMAAAAVNGIEELDLVGTVFEEGASVAVVYGSVLAGLGALAYWSPKWSGRNLPTAAVGGLGLLGAGAAALASGPYLVAGFADQPAAAVAFDYDGPTGLWNLLAMLGHAGFLVVVVLLAGLALRPAGDAASDAAAGDDPWDGQTLEWATTSPAPADNFSTVPLVHSAEPLLDLKAAATGGTDSRSDA
jgi:heme/copper-type cytochrome/quinol oxidase subunit 1